MVTRTEINRRIFRYGREGFLISGFRQTFRIFCPSSYLSIGRSWWVSSSCSREMNSFFRFSEVTMNVGAPLSSIYASCKVNRDSTIDLISENDGKFIGEGSWSCAGGKSETSPNRNVIDPSNVAHIYKSRCFLKKWKNAFKIFLGPLYPPVEILNSYLINAVIILDSCSAV